ncbi:Protein phosphatase 1 regulatory subunit 37 isoform 1 [Schistosoma japonicum]|uniref:Protein phosphatase 1 regulatory subunit 37 isoform 1 n=1 Tax=Schistosoma japonicum TaxID=6182 RepID=A0A4Z2CRG9_SCHJA|nr:Protein phosphatase 1 regulatory subunit 37 isoform 1 [Schistosoma japonicum]
MLKRSSSRSKSVSSPLVEKTRDVSKKSVKFPGERDLVTCVINPVDPWSNRQCLSPYELISVYKFHCELSKIQPLYSVISQLQFIDLKQSLERRDVFDLKGCQLNGGHIDLLEYVFKYVQFQYLNLENTNLDDESIESLYEILSYYETCTELCLARNPHVSPDGWIPIAFLFREIPYMKWLDLRENNLGLTSIQILSLTLRIQYKENGPKQSEAEDLEKSDFLLPNKLCYNANLKSMETESLSTSNSCTSKISSLHSRGLHLGSTGINGKLLKILIPGIRLGCITDLRLPNNGITGSDAKLLAPLLRYGLYLKYLDLSGNLLGDIGCSTISEALTSPCFSSNIWDSGKSQAGLIRLFLSENMITSSSMNKLAAGLIRCTRLTTLQLSGNLNIGSIGLLELKSSLINCPCLKRLGFGFCGIDNNGAECITEILTKAISRFSAIDLTGNPIGPEGYLTILNSSAYLNEKVRIIGLDVQTPSLIEYTRQLLGKENNSVSYHHNHKSAVYNHELNSLRDNQLSRNNNRRNSHISSRKHTNSWKNKFFSLPILHHNHKAYSILDPHYLWGDSSDDDDDRKMNYLKSRKNSASVNLEMNRSYLSERNYKQSKGNRSMKYHSVS